MSSTTPGQDGEENGASSTDDIEKSSTNQRSFRDGRSVSATSQSALNLAGPSSSSNITEGTFQPEPQLIDDQHPLDLFSFGEHLVSSHSSSQSFASSVVNTTGYDSSHEFGAISSTLPPVFENIFGQSPPDDVGGAFSMDDVVRTGYAPWDDIDVLSVGLNVPKVLMQDSETDDGIDESDGTSSNLPDSSSSKFGKSKSKEKSVSNSTNVSSERASAVRDHSSSPFRQPLLQFEDGSPDYEQCSSSSDLSIAKLTLPPNVGENTSSHSPSAASTSGYSGRKDGREILIDQNETPSKFLQFIKSDPIDPNYFFDIKSDTSASQKPTASSSSDLFSNEDLLNSSQGEFFSLPGNVESSFTELEERGYKLNDGTSSSLQLSVPSHQQERNLSSPSPSTTPENAIPVKKSSIAESPSGEFPISSSSSVRKVSPPSIVAASLAAEMKEQSRIEHSSLPFHGQAPLDPKFRDVDKGLSSEISTSSANLGVGGSRCPVQHGVSSSKLSASTSSRSTVGDKSVDDDWEQETSSVSSPMSGIGSSTNVTQLVKKKRVKNSTPRGSSQNAETAMSEQTSSSNQDVVQGQRLADVTQGVSSSVTHRSKSASSKNHESIKHDKNHSSPLGDISKNRIVPDSQQYLSSTALKHSSTTKQFDSRMEPSSSSFSSGPHPNRLEVQSDKNSPTSNISVALNMDAAGDAAVDTTADLCQTICPASRTSKADDIIPSMSSTSVDHDPNREGQIASGSSRTSLTAKPNTEPLVTIGQLTGSSNHPVDSMDVDEAASSSDPGAVNHMFHKDNQHSAKTMNCATPSHHQNKADVSHNKVDCNVNSTSEAEMVEEDTVMDASKHVESGVPADMVQGTSSFTSVALESSVVGEGTAASIQPTTDSALNEDSSAQGKCDEIDEGSDFSDSDIDIDDLLDKDLPDEYKKPSKGKKRTIDGEEKSAEATGQQDVGEGEEPAPGKEPGVISFSKKTVLRKKGREPLEGLPEHWIGATHRSRLTVYIHRKSRVCTWSRPYFLGPGSVRKHRVPLASIPCLHYIRAKEEEASPGGNDKKVCVPTSSSGDNAGGAAAENSTAECPGPSQISEGQGKTDESKATAGSIPNGKDATPTEDGKNGKDVAPTEDGKKAADTGKDDPYKNKVQMRPDETVEPDELNAYARRVFEFEDVVLRRFQKWADKRKFWKSRKAKEVVDRPQLPAVPLFDVEMPSMTGNKAVRKKECALNMKDKTPIAILHEYCQKVLRTHPKYVVEESNNAHHPFEAVVFLEGTKYGRGQAQSKKVARLNAARQTLEILLPEVMASQKNDQDDGGIEFFNQISIDDPRVVDLCSKTGQMTPFSVLQDYQQRMHGQNNSKLDFQVTVDKYQKLEYTMKLGPHEAKGSCKSSKVGKQLGAQQILKQLYPKITTWGGIIKLYGKGVDEINKAKREEQKRILALSKKQKNKPNEKILHKLKTEMLKLYGPQSISDPSSAPASVAPSGIHPNQRTEEEKSSQVQNQVDT